LDDLGRDLALIHGDVSPHNVLLASNGEVKLMDFGLARASANLADRPLDRISGKYGYLSPEMVLRREATQSMDLFALGVVLWECVTGKRLFNARNLSESRKLLRNFDVPKPSLLNPAVTGAVEELITRLLARDPAERVRSARELLGLFDAVMRSIPRDMCREASARLVQLNLGEKKKPASTRVNHLTDEELEEFFATSATTVYQRPSLAPVADEVLNAFVTEYDTGMLPQPPEK
ncbi:MAG TPA: protein kinase, partial [Polyangiales bacterium]